MVYIRRMIWFVSKRLLILCIAIGILVCGFYMCLNTSDIYVVLTDGMEQRARTILTRENESSLNFYFDAGFLSTDPALEGAFDGTSVYDDYTITDFDYQLTIEKIWAWPWDNNATCTVVERIPEITGTVIASRRNRVSSTIPQWQGGRYDLTLTRVNGTWKIAGMQQVTVLMEAVETSMDETVTNTQ